MGVWCRGLEVFNVVFILTFSLCAYLVCGSVTVCVCVCVFVHCLRLAAFFMVALPPQHPRPPSSWSSLELLFGVKTPFLIILFEPLTWKC